MNNVENLWLHEQSVTLAKNTVGGRCEVAAPEGMAASPTTSSCCSIFCGFTLNESDLEAINLLSEVSRILRKSVLKRLISPATQR